MPNVKLHTNVSDEANYGTTKYRVGNSGNIEVPVEAAESLIRIGGYVEEKDPVPPPDGSVAVIGEPGSSVSWGGESYTADGDGHVTVPLAALADVEAHGFTIPPEEAPAPVVEIVPAPVAEPVVEPTPVPVEAAAPAEPETASEPIPEASAEPVAEA